MGRETWHPITVRRSSLRALGVLQLTVDLDQQSDFRRIESYRKVDIRLVNLRTFKALRRGFGIVRRAQAEWQCGCRDCQQ